MTLLGGECICKDSFSRSGTDKPAYLQSCHWIYTSAVADCPECLTTDLIFSLLNKLAGTVASEWWRSLAVTLQQSISGV